MAQRTCRMLAAALVICAGALAPTKAAQTAQSNPAAPPDGSAPIYRVTVVSRTTKAINYGHRTEPTKVDLKGTVLLPEARGDATVQSRRGSAVIEAKFSHVDAPTRFGSQYLTYVLWAITPEGRPANLGELVLNSSDKGKLTVAANLQAFALIVTAEPYFSVTQPSDLVVMENFLRPDTIGKVEEVTARFELLPRKAYTYDVGSHAGTGEGPKVSMKQYEALLALYEAQNAFHLAQAAEAQRYAQPSFQKAQQLYQQALNYQASKTDSKQIVATAREAAQAAEDARTIAVKRAIDDSGASRTSN
jgi:hypothetical protein